MCSEPAPGITDMVPLVRKAATGACPSPAPTKSWPLSRPRTRAVGNPFCTTRAPVEVARFKPVPPRESGSAASHVNVCVEPLEVHPMLVSFTTVCTGATAAVKPLREVMPLPVPPPVPHAPQEVVAVGTAPSVMRHCPFAPPFDGNVRL